MHDLDNETGQTTSSGRGHWSGYGVCQESLGGEWVRISTSTAFAHGPREQQPHCLPSQLYGVLRTLPGFQSCRCPRLNVRCNTAAPHPTLHSKTPKKKISPPAPIGTHPPLPPPHAETCRTSAQPQPSPAHPRCPLPSIPRQAPALTVCTPSLGSPSTTIGTKSVYTPLCASGRSLTLPYLP